MLRRYVNDHVLLDVCRKVLYNTTLTTVMIRATGIFNNHFKSVIDFVDQKYLCLHKHKIRRYLNLKFNMLLKIFIR